MKLLVLEGANSQAADVVIAIVHHKHERIPRKMDLVILNGIANLADEFQVSVPLIPWVNYWIPSMEKENIAPIGWMKTWFEIIAALRLTEHMPEPTQTITKNRVQFGTLGREDEISFAKLSPELSLELMKDIAVDLAKNVPLAKHKFPVGDQNS